MSNPGVLTLTEKEISPTKSFRVEDNLAESIHFHYNDIRVDLTISELNYIAGVCDESIYDLVHVSEFDMDQFDGDFLNQYSQCFIDLEHVTTKTMKTNQLYSLEKGILGLPFRKKITASQNSAEISMEYKPVVFNDGDTIVYGKAIIEALLQQGVDEVEVVELAFEKGKHGIPNSPWVDYLFKWDKKRLISFAKTAAKKFLG